MKVVVFGGAGAMAAVAIRDLLEFAEDISITVADTREVRFADPRLKSVIADVRNLDSTTKIVGGHDVVVNCVTYYFNVDVMKASLKARVPYVDLGGLYHGTNKQFALQEDFANAGIIALLGMGSTPGITNVMAGTLASKMDSVRELHVRVAAVDESASGPLPIPYALDTVLDEFALEPMVFTEGKPKAVPPMSGAETIQFPAPVGKAEAIFTLHSEVAMFPRSFPGLKEASFKVAFAKDFTEKMKFLVELGFASREKISRDVSPREMLLAVASRQQVPESEPRDCDVLRVIAKGTKAGKDVTGVAESIILPHPQWKMAAGSLDTGVPLSIAAQMLAKNRITGAGVLCPEVSVPQDEFFQELKRRNIEVRISDFEL
jgi:saccharopine dehydrogenase-like NADP-dependent oxidoreductase